MKEFTVKVRKWMLYTFGQEIMSDKGERNYRFMEEALELVQSCGCSKDDVLRLVDYVYSRPGGDVRDELGDVMVTLSALSIAHELPLEAFSNDILCRNWRNADKIREKQKNKPVRSPLAQ